MSLFVKRPTRKLTWNTKDFEMGKKWCQTQPHPFKKGKSLWDLVYDKYESVNTLDNMNKFLFKEI